MELQAVVDEITRTKFKLDTRKGKVASSVSAQMENDRLAIEGFKRQGARYNNRLKIEQNEAKKAWQEVRN
jgi:hypothetical protein